MWGRGRRQRSPSSAAFQEAHLHTPVTGNSPLQGGTGLRLTSRGGSLRLSTVLPRQPSVEVCPSRSAEGDGQPRTLDHPSSSISHQPPPWARGTAGSCVSPSRGAGTSRDTGMGPQGSQGSDKRCSQPHCGLTRHPPALGLISHSRERGLWVPSCSHPTHASGIRDRQPSAQPWPRLASLAWAGLPRATSLQGLPLCTEAPSAQPSRKTPATGRAAGTGRRFPGTERAPSRGLPRAREHPTRAERWPRSRPSLRQGPGRPVSRRKPRQGTKPGALGCQSVRAEPGGPLAQGSLLGCCSESSKQPTNRSARQSVQEQADSTPTED